MNKRKKQLATSVRLPKFANENAEATWWASAKGRRFLKEHSAARTAGPRSSVQIALRLPAPDPAKAREIAERKGIGYQTLLKMLVHEGLRREARR